MRFRLSDWMAAGAVFLVVLLTATFWGWRYLRMEKTAIAAVGPAEAGAPPAAPVEAAKGKEPAPETPPVPPEPESFFVHVAGAVQKPGVYELKAGARVFEAVREAGGPTDEAQLDRINLAQPLQDGIQIFVPAKGDEPAPGAAPVSAPASAPAAAAGVAGKVDINRAPSAELQKIPGIGPALADRIIRYRETNGPFRSVDDLTKVSGIGPATLEKIRPHATVSR